MLIFTLIFYFTLVFHIFILFVFISDFLHDVQELGGGVVFSI